MATPERTVTESIQEDFLTCSICLQVFTDPRILPCLHTYCFQCICTHVDAAEADHRPALCPECRGPVTEVVSTLKKNFFINGLAEIIKEKTVEGLVCTGCDLRGKTAAAKSKCLDCGDYLCSSCSEGHNSSSQTWKHEKIPLDDIKLGKYDDKLRQLQKIKCSKHEDKDVEFYCESCSKSVCLTCVLLYHREHKCKTIAEAVSEKRKDISKLTNKLRKTLESYQSEEKTLEKTVKERKTKEERERNAITEKADQEIARVLARRDEELAQLAASLNTEEYDAKLVSLKQQNDVLSSCIRFTDNILKKGKDVEVLMLESMLTNRLVHLQQFKVEVLSERRTSDSVQPRKEDETDKTQKSSNQKPPVTMKKVKTLSSKCDTDTKNPDVKGIAYSSTVGLVISDKANGKLKILNRSGKLVKEITTTGFRPYAVAVAGDRIGAISENCLFIFKLDGKVTAMVKVANQSPKENIPFSFSLAASEARTVGFVVGNVPGEDRLHFYTTDGKFSRYLYCSVKFPLAALSVTPRNNVVLSEWGSGQVRVITVDGQDITSFGQKQWKPNGTCCVSDGIIYIADYNSGGISTYNQSAQRLQFAYCTKRDGISNPQFVVLDEDYQLYVADFTGKVCIYQLSKVESD